jgi:hypothetical protein
MKEFEIGVAGQNHGVIMFHTWRNKIPEGVQVLSMGGGTVASTAPVPASSPDEHLANVRPGLDSFLEHCSIDDVVVSEGMNGYCRVYVNWQSWEILERKNPGKKREQVWYTPGDAYQTFLRSLFVGEYKSAKVRREGDKVSVRFSDKPATARAETKIVFVPVKKPEVKKTGGGRNTLHLPRKA